MAQTDGTALSKSTTMWDVSRIMSQLMGFGMESTEKEPQKYSLGQERGELPGGEKFGFHSVDWKSLECVKHTGGITR